MNRYDKKSYYGEDYAKRSMILGICSIALPFLGAIVMQILALCIDETYTEDLMLFIAEFAFNAFAVIFAIFALVQHGKWKKYDGLKNKYAEAGKICGIIGLVFGIIPLILFILGMIFLPIIFPNGILNLPG
ncbi:MAG: hypothetical protein J1E62_05540 [Lachnospiraceae bacterium]|nr:hypothetical protein [Lachnospiraceae bacterium]